MRHLALFLSVPLAGLFISAQQRTGSMTGLITDPSGAAVAGAQVKLESPSNGLRREAATDSSGAYTLALLPVGSYDITVSAKGFQAQTRPALPVNVNDTLRIDFQLSLATQETTVSVNAEAPLVNTADSTSGVVVQSRQIVDLPLNGRNFTQLGLLIPGAIPTPQRLGGATTNSAFSINGQRTQSNNFLLDGVSNNDTLNSGYVLTPPPDSLAQFKMVTHNYAAEYGQNAGSVVTAITRSGSNQPHGALWNFLRNDALDARNFFSASKPPLRLNQFGASAGAPLAKDKTFIYGYYEGVRSSEGLVNNVVVLSDLERSGNYSASSVKPRDPSTGQFFPGDIIPSASIDAAARNILERYIPRSNSAGNRYLAAPARTVESHQYGLRGDHRFSAANSLFLRYSYGSNDNFNPLGPANFSPAGSAAKDYNHGAVMSDTHAFSPALLNETSFSFLRQISLPVTRSGVSPADLGFAYTPTEATALGMPLVQLSGFFTVGDAGQAFTQIARNNYQFNDNLTWIRGRHSLKMGFDFQRSQIFLVFPNRPNGDYTINGSASGNVTADFLLGRAAQFRQGGGDPSKHFFGSTYGFYFQDDWKVSRRLTLNLGLRYDLGLPYYDKYDRVASFQPGQKSTVRPDAPVNLLYPGDNGLPRATIQTDANNFAPRFGFAYDLTGSGNTSIRGGYGIFYDAIPGVAVFQNINVPPFNRFIQVDGVPSFTNPYQNFPTNPQTDPSRNFPCPCLVIGFSPELRSPYAQHWHLTVQQRLPFQLLAEVGYVGSSGLKFPGYREVNPAVPGPGATLANTQARRLYRDFNLVRPTFGDFNSNYNAFQARLEKRYSSGLQFLASYMYSKAIDFQSSVNLGDPRPQDAFSMSDIRGLAIFDTRQRFVFSGGYELPWGFLLQGIVSAQSGNPLTATESVDLTLRGLNADRPDQIGDPNNGPRTPQEFFARSAFSRLTAVPGGQRSGTAGRNTIIGPGLFQADLAVLKRFAFLETHSLELRAEFFNAFNNVNFLNPLTNIGAPQTFGVVQQARPARIIQFGLKYAF